MEKKEEVKMKEREKNGLKKEEKVQNKKEVKEKEKKENTVGQIESRDEPIYNSFESHWILKTNSTRGTSLWSSGLESAFQCRGHKVSPCPGN